MSFVLSKKKKRHICHFFAYMKHDGETVMVPCDLAVEEEDKPF